MLRHDLTSRQLFRGVRAAVLLAVGSMAASISHAGAPAATVAAIESARVADLVVLDRGFNAGLRQGMVCRITRGATEVAEVILVDLRRGCSTALILSLAPKQSIRPGDLAAIKVLKT